MITAAMSFDRLASQYDALWSRTYIGRSQRQAVWRRIDPLFRRGDRILDLGCGTGEDARHLASRGVEVLGIDASQKMVRVARSRGINAQPLAVEYLARLSGEFDGAISNFGVLNCVERMETAASELARLIRPGGYAAICVLGPLCCWEIFHFLLEGEFRKVFRRCTRAAVITSLGVAVSYPSRDRLLSAFRPWFEPIQWYGIGLCVPPSYVQLRPRAVCRASAIDRRIAHWPILRGLADHRLFIFRRL